MTDDCLLGIQMEHAVDDIYASELPVGATKIVFNDSKGNQTQEINIEEAGIFPCLLYILHLLIKNTEITLDFCALKC